MHYWKTKFIRFNFVIDFNLTFILLYNNKSIFKIYLSILYWKNWNGIFLNLDIFSVGHEKFLGWKKTKVNLKGKKEGRNPGIKLFVPCTTQTDLQGRWNSYKKECLYRSGHNVATATGQELKENQMQGQVRKIKLNIIFGKNTKKKVYI